MRRIVVVGTTGSGKTTLARVIAQRWALQTYRRYREEYSTLLSRPEYAHLTVVHFRSPKATSAWLAGLPDTRLRSSTKNKIPTY